MPDGYKLKPSDRNIILAGLLMLAVGWWLASSPSSPIRPEPPRPDRPVLRFIARVAKTFLWVMVVAERPPQDQTVQMVHARIDSEGNQVLNHGQGW
jgi:hypothetical protein